MKTAGKKNVTKDTIPFLGNYARKMLSQMSHHILVQIISTSPAELHFSWICFYLKILTSLNWPFSPNIQLRKSTLITKTVSWSYLCCTANQIACGYTKAVSKGANATSYKERLGRDHRRAFGSRLSSPNCCSRQMFSYPVPNIEAPCTS